MMKNVGSLILCSACAFASAESKKTFEPNWDSLRQYECPEWFQDAKFGFYAHWGVYSVPEAAHASDWYLPDVPWNHAQVAAGSPIAGAWQISVAENGVYKFEVLRWPREAKATIQGVPDFCDKTVDAWDAWKGIDKLIYGQTMKALPVQSILFEVDDYSETKLVKATDQKLVFEVPLQKGDTQVKGLMLDKAGEVIAGTYYVYVTRQ